MLDQKALLQCSSGFNFVCHFPSFFFHWFAFLFSFCPIRYSSVCFFFFFSFILFIYLSNRDVKVNLYQLRVSFSFFFSQFKQNIFSSLQFSTAPIKHHKEKLKYFIFLNFFILSPFFIIPFFYPLHICLVGVKQKGQKIEEREQILGLFGQSGKLDGF